MAYVMKNIAAMTIISSETVAPPCMATQELSAIRFLTNEDVHIDGDRSVPHL
jgi:hypothetical protein